MMNNKKMKFKAFIRVVKSLNKDGYLSFTGDNIVEERLIEAKDKDEVKQFLLSKYPQFFQNNKVYTKETKDVAQFFYVVIFPLYNFELTTIEEGEWICDQCKQIHENKYISRPKIDHRLFPNKLFCFSEDNICMNNFKKEYYKDVELPDDEYYIRKNSPNYIYKITEKATGKCYIGKTRNEPFFRWWSHYKHSNYPFGLYLSKTKITDWNFEVIHIMPSEVSDKEVFRIESDYILKYDSILNGFNSLISNKSVNA